MLVADVNGNIAIYGASDLAAFGKATVTVTNAGGHDIVAPTLTTGTALTRKVSLGTPPPGTGQGTVPFIDASLKAGDTGNGAVSGAYIASMSFCLPDKWGNCRDTIELDGKVDAPKLASTTIRMSGSPHAGQVPGKYGFQQVFLMDIAGNAAVIKSDLAALFPKGTIVDVMA